MIRQNIREVTYLPDAVVLDALVSLYPDKATRRRIVDRAIGLVETLRATARPALMERFLGQYGLSSEEGVALMCLAEALLRVPDTTTIDALIQDKIVSSDWKRHLGTNRSVLVNASTWALFITGKVLSVPEEGLVGLWRDLVKRLGEPVIRQVMTRMMQEIGHQFVLGETISSALKRARTYEDQGYSYSYDMLGEAAVTESDAAFYYTAYSQAIAEIARAVTSDHVCHNPGISIKLSALHPRYDLLHRHQILAELVPQVLSLALLARSAGIGLNIDAEEAARLDLSLDVIEAVLSDSRLAGWDGFGVVIQAYGKRAACVIDWFYDLATRLERKVMVRLVKGAYWDTEIKRAQVDGLPGFPVFQAKAHTDIHYICCAAKLLDKTDRIYPQFATHNAHTLAAVLELAENRGISHFECQRLHGMGEALHDQILKTHRIRCRIYAPVGRHHDLLAYLVRRLLENGANSSFVHQIFDETVPSKMVAADPFEEQGRNTGRILAPDALFAGRVHAQGVDMADPDILNLVQSEISAQKFWDYGPGVAVRNPANGDHIGNVRFFDYAEAARKAQDARPWNAPVAMRAEILRRVADLYQDHRAEIFQLLCQEAGKTVIDCIGEWREAIDFLRFYAEESGKNPGVPLGVFVCISPWNFPLAIFTGQIALLK